MSSVKIYAVEVLDLSEKGFSGLRENLQENKYIRFVFKSYRVSV